MSPVALLVAASVIPDQRAILFGIEPEKHHERCC